MEIFLLSPLGQSVCPCCKTSLEYVCPVQPCEIHLFRSPSTCMCIYADNCMVFNQDVFSELGFLLPQWRGLGIEIQFLQGKSMRQALRPKPDPRQTAWVQIPTCCWVTLGKPLRFVCPSVFCFLIFQLADHTIAVYIICKTDLGSSPGSATK